MFTRRTLLAGISASLATAAHDTENKAVTVHVQPLPAPFQDWEAEFLKVTTVPGPGSAPHHHQGFVLGHVLDGAFRFALDRKPEQILHAGEAFYEPPGAEHRVSASASSTDSVHVLAIVIKPKSAAHDR